MLAKKLNSSQSRTTFVTEQIPSLCDIGGATPDYTFTHTLQTHTHARTHIYTTNTHILMSCMIEML